MDISGGLTITAQALGIVKDLRNIESDISSAEYKLKIAELTEALSDVKIAFSEAKNLLHEKDLKISELSRKLDEFKSGEVCPICDIGRMKVAASTPHPKFGKMGIFERTLSCTHDGCGHQEKHLHDPTGLLDRQ